MCIRDSCFTILIGNTVTPDRGRGVKELFGAQEDILKAIERHWNKPGRAKR